MTFAASIFSLTPRQSPFRGSEGVQLRSWLNEHGGSRCTSRRSSSLNATSRTFLFKGLPILGAHDSHPAPLTELLSEPWERVGHPQQSADRHHELCRQP